MKTLFLAACLSAGAASLLLGQSPTQRDDLHVWVSAALGPSIQSGFQRVGGDISIWGSRGGTTLAIRNAGVSAAFEPGEKHDYSVLIGRRAPFRAVTLVGGVGMGVASGHRNGYETLESETVLAVGGQAIAGFSWAGIGLSAFGTFGRTLKYGGIGLTIAVGGIK